MFIVLVFLTLLNTILKRNQQNPCSVSQRYQTVEHELKNNNHEIPKIIHQQWKNKDIPVAFQGWFNEWKNIFPENEGYECFLSHGF